ncbi:MAG: adenylyltransferase/cytidyltransferase family protein [Chlamydiales bacterium]
MIAWKEYSQKKVIHPENLDRHISTIRNCNQTIASINGSFDLLHAGHLHILFEGSKKADIFIVAVNSDESVGKYKDPDRPIISLNYRIEMLTALTFVDYVTWFHEADSRAILEIIRPNIHINGEEYGEECIEAGVVKQYGGILHLVPRIPGLATSQIIQKIRELQADTCV